MSSVVRSLYCNPCAGRTHLKKIGVVEWLYANCDYCFEEKPKWWVFHWINRAKAIERVLFARSISITGNVSHTAYVDSSLKRFSAFNELIKSRKNVFRWLKREATDDDEVEKSHKNQIGPTVNEPILLATNRNSTKSTHSSGGFHFVFVCHVYKLISIERYPWNVNKKSNKI